jgi:hypothetical protein
MFPALDQVPYGRRHSYLRSQSHGSTIAILPSIVADPKCGKVTTFSISKNLGLTRGSFS